MIHLFELKVFFSVTHGNIAQNVGSKKKVIFVKIVRYEVIGEKLKAPKMIVRRIET